MNPERIAELQRQRDLVRAHLAWLEAEIEAARNSSAPQPVAPQPPPVEAPPARSGLAPAPEFAAKLAVDTAVAHYQPDPGSAARDVRRGCLLAATVGLLLMVGMLAAVYLAYYRDRPLIFLREAAPAEKLPQ